MQLIASHAAFASLRAELESTQDEVRELQSATPRLQERHAELLEMQLANVLRELKAQKRSAEKTHQREVVNLRAKGALQLAVDEFSQRAEERLLKPEEHSRVAPSKAHISGNHAWRAAWLDSIGKTDLLDPFRRRDSAPSTWTMMR